MTTFVTQNHSQSEKPDVPTPSHISKQTLNDSIRVSSSTESLSSSLGLTELPEKQPRQAFTKSPVGIYEVSDIYSAKKYIFENPTNDLIVACGWPR